MKAWQLIAGTFGLWGLDAGELYRYRAEPRGRIVPKVGGTVEMPQRPETKRDRLREKRKAKKLAARARA